MIVNSRRYSGFGAITPALNPGYRPEIWEMSQVLELKVQLKSLEAAKAALDKRLKEVAASDPMAAQFKSAVKTFQKNLLEAASELEKYAYNDVSFGPISVKMSDERTALFRGAAHQYLEALSAGNAKLQSLFEKLDAAQEIADATPDTTTTRAPTPRIAPAALDLSSEDALSPAPAETNWLLLGGGIAGGLLLLGVGGFFAFRKKAPSMAGYHGRRSCGGLRGCR
jgi:hypothetical protein